MRVEAWARGTILRPSVLNGTTGEQANKDKDDACTEVRTVEHGSKPFSQAVRLREKTS